MARTAVNNIARQATKKGMDALINAGGAAFGLPPGTAKPVIGFFLALAALVIGFTVAIGFMFAYFLGFLRHFNKQGGNGGNLNALTVVSANATIYVNLVYPSGGECTSKFGGSYIFKKDSTEVACSAVTTAQRSDSGFKIGVKLGGTFYEGAAAANDLDTFPGGALFPGSPSASSGTTHWLAIPGYHNAATGTPTTTVPVVGVIANTSTTRKGKNGEDLRLRYDLIVKDRTEADAIKNVWQSNDNCKNTDPDNYDCAVTGVTIKYGLPVSAVSSSWGDGYETTPQGFPRFLQYKGPWKSNIYGSACSDRPTVASSACGPSALASVLKYYLDSGRLEIKEIYRGEFGTDINPGTIATLSDREGMRACGIGTKPEMFNRVGSKYFNLRATEASWTAAQAALQNGTPVIASMGPGYFTSSGHFIPLFSIDTASGVVYLSDSYVRNRTQATVDVVTSQAKYFQIITIR